MADQPLEVVSTPAPKFRVRSVPHGEPAGIETELEQADADGYELEDTLAQANGDVLLTFRHREPA